MADVFFFKKWRPRPFLNRLSSNKKIEIASGCSLAKDTTLLTNQFDGRWWITKQVVIAAMVLWQREWWVLPYLAERIRLLLPAICCWAEILKHDFLPIFSNTVPSPEKKLSLLLFFNNIELFLSRWKTINLMLSLKHCPSPRSDSYSWNDKSGLRVHTHSYRYIPWWYNKFCEPWLSGQRTRLLS